MSRAIGLEQLAMRQTTVVIGRDGIERTASVARTAGGSVVVRVSREAVPSDRRRGVCLS